MLQQRRDGHDEKTAGEPEQRQPDERGIHGQSRHGQPHGNQRHAERAERDEAVFDFSAGQVARRDAAEADAEREGNTQLADADLVQVQDLRAIKKHIQLQQLAQEEEIRVAEKGEGEWPVTANQPELREQIAEKIRVEFPAGIGGRHAGNAEAREEADDGERNQNESRPGLASVKMFRHLRGGDGAQDDGQERAEFDQAVAPG